MGSPTYENSGALSALGAQAYVNSGAPSAPQTRSLALDAVDPNFSGPSWILPRGAILKHFRRRQVKSRTGDRLKRMVRKFT